MNKQKLNYLAPEAETLVIRFEENIMSPNQVRSNSASSGYGVGDDYDLGEI